MNPVAMSIITQVFTGRVERARAIGIWGGVVGISMALGPDRRRRAHPVRRLARGVLDQPADLCDRDPVDRDLRAGVQVGDDARRRPDRPGPRHGVPVRHRVRAHRRSRHGLGQPPHRRGRPWSRLWRSSPSCRYEARRHDPFIDLRFFRSIPFASATMIAVCAFAAWGAFLFMMSLYLQGERGFSAMHTGLIYLPVAVGALIFSPLVRPAGRAIRQPAFADRRRNLDHRRRR